MVTESVKDWALIIHADSSGTRVDVYWVDINAGRIGLRLANEVRQWRRRDDLLTIGRRLRTVVESEPPAIEPAVPSERPPEDAQCPPEPRRLASRHDYLAARIRALVAHSDVAAKALQIAWPQGVSGLRNDGQTWEQLDAITGAVEFVESNYSIPFYPPWDDPAIEKAKEEHPSNVWAQPQTRAATQEDRETIQMELVNHPRSDLMRKWIAFAIDGGIDHSIDSTALAHALFEFGKVDAIEWPDDDITTMLDGSLRALGYANGVMDLGRFNPEHAPLLMSAAFAIVAGNAMLLFDEDEKPIVRTNVKGAK